MYVFFCFVFFQNYRNTLNDRKGLGNINYTIAKFGETCYRGNMMTKALKKEERNLLESSKHA